VRAVHSAIRLTDVTKRFDGVTAVDRLTLAVPGESIYGFIGPNGSGKTTTLRMIMHLLLPDEGRIEVLGSADTRAARDRVGYLPEERGLYKKMQVRRLLRYYGRLKGRSIAELDPVIDEWLARLGMAGWGDRKIETLSKGMSQKVQFVAAVVSRPELLILDEPFSGLDPVNAEALKDAVLEVRRHGTTVVFSTHDMATAERMCAWSRELRARFDTALEHFDVGKAFRPIFGCLTDSARVGESRSIENDFLCLRQRRRPGLQGGEGYGPVQI